MGTPEDVDKRYENIAAGLIHSLLGTHTLMPDKGNKFKVLIQFNGMQRLMLSGLQLFQKFAGSGISSRPAAINL